ncbi:MAG: hypothetical protein C4527_16145 [Candidatus Omnitrophota bacterium]|nr:MAG: hypothetical protein C4527_16145 [Candidatus Omnitrophota bacterium]
MRYFGYGGWNSWTTTSLANFPRRIWLFRDGITKWLFLKILERIDDIQIYHVDAKIMFYIGKS